MSIPHNKRCRDWWVYGTTFGFFPDHYGFFLWSFVQCPSQEYSSHMEKSPFSWKPRVAKSRPMLGTSAVLSGKGVYGTKLTVTRHLGFWGLIRGTLSPYIFAFYDMQGVLITDSNSGLYGIFMIHQTNLIESFRRIWNVFFWDLFCHIIGRWKISFSC